MQFKAGNIFQLMALASLVYKMIADVKEAMKDGKITDEEISKNILGNVILIIQCVEPNFDANRFVKMLGENTGTMSTAQQFIKSLPFVSM
jgi:hypothetical protein